MKNRKIGNWNVPAMGLGCMPLSGMPHDRLDLLDDRPRAISVIHAALDLGVRLLDTADIYAAYWNQFGHNEMLVAEAVRTWSGTQDEKKKILIATKGGITRGPGESWGRAASVDYLLRAAEASALRLGVDQISLWQHHRLDPSIPFETQFENVLVLKDRGLVREIGVSNYNAKQLTIALSIAGKDGIASVQNERSPKYLRESDVLKVCEENNVAYLPWSPLGGVGSDTASREFNSVILEMAQSKSVTPFALTMAWHLHSSPMIIPIPGATKVSSLVDSYSGLNIPLSLEEMSQINLSLKGDPGIPPDLFAQPLYRR